MSIWRAENRPHFPSSLTSVIKNGLVGTTSTSLPRRPIFEKEIKRDAVAVVPTDGARALGSLSCLPLTDAPKRRSVEV
jgi:hypothetical protein